MLDFTTAYWRIQRPLIDSYNEWTIHLYFNSGDSNVLTRHMSQAMHTRLERTVTSICRLSSWLCVQTANSAAQVRRLGFYNLRYSFPNLPLYRSSHIISFSFNCWQLLPSKKTFHVDEWDSVKHGAEMFCHSSSNSVAVFKTMPTLVAVGSVLLLRSEVGSSLHLRYRCYRWYRWCVLASRAVDNSNQFFHSMLPIWLN